MKKAMSLTLGLMPYRAVVVWRDVKHLTTAWRGSGKNSHGQFEVAEVRILIINL
jgi:hypothetical protein